MEWSIGRREQKLVSTVNEYIISNINLERKIRRRKADSNDHSAEIPTSGR